MGGAFALLALGATDAAQAAGGATVVEGAADIVETAPGTIEVRQQSDRIIIEWQNFDIGAGDSVTFIQPDALAAALNRVLGGEVTSILGSLTSNGQIVITNPKGIVFGPAARVDVASIIASSLGITDGNFLNGRMVFDQPGDPGAAVSNAGTITAAEGGLAALVAPGVENRGVITARLGTVALAAGNAATLDFFGDGLVQIAVSEPVQDVPAGPDGQPMAALVNNTGAIYADGGTVVLTAEAAEGVLDRVINLEGVVQARSIESRSGQVALVGGSTGDVQVAGLIDASGKDAGETGGTVHVLGGKVRLADGASIDVSGDAGGGTVLVGGDLQGKAHQPTGTLAYKATSAGKTGTTIVLSKAIDTGGFIPKSQVTFVEPGASVTADAVTKGDGGKVIIWADRTTAFKGDIAARGGAAGGDGGFVEVSGKLQLAFAGAVDTTAPHGSVGMLLLDPSNGELSANAPADVQVLPDTPVAGTTTISDDPGAAVSPSVFNVTVLVTTLATSNVLVSTSSAEAEAGNFDILSAITWGSANSLTFDVDGNLTVDAAIGYTGTAAALNFMVDGSVFINAPITSTGGRLDVNISSGLDTAVGAPITTNGGDLTINNGGSTFVDAAITLFSTTGQVGNAPNFQQNGNDVFLNADILAGSTAGVTGSQIAFSGPVTIVSSVRIFNNIDGNTAAAPADVIFNDSVDGFNAGLNDLDVRSTDEVLFAAPVGAVTPLRNLDVSGLSNIELPAGNGLTTTEDTALVSGGAAPQGVVVTGSGFSVFGDVNVSELTVAGTSAVLTGALTNAVLPVLVGPVGPGPYTFNGIDFAVAGALVDPFLAVSPTPGAGPNVRVFDDTFSQISSFFAGNPAFLGGTSVALAQIGNANVVVTGANGEIRVFDADTQQQINAFSAFGAGFAGGVSVAIGDIGNQPVIVAGAGAGGGPQVRVFSAQTGVLLNSFLAFDPGFLGGIDVAAGDFNADGVDDIVVGAGPGIGPQVSVFNGVDSSLVLNFLAFAPGFNGGVFVAAGDLNGDGFAEIVTGAGPGGGPQVRVFDERNQAVLSDFLAFAPGFNGGVSVSVGDLAGTPVIVAGTATQVAQVRVFDAGTLNVLQDFLPYGVPGAFGIDVSAIRTVPVGDAPIVVDISRILLLPEFADRWTGDALDPSFYGTVVTGLDPRPGTFEDVLRRLTLIYTAIGLPPPTDDEAWFLVDLLARQDATANSIRQILYQTDLQALTLVNVAPVQPLLDVRQARLTALAGYRDALAGFAEGGTPAGAAGIDTYYLTSIERALLNQQITGVPAQQALVHGLAVDPLNPNRVFVVGSGGISIVGGDVPARTFPEATGRVTAVTTDPSDPTGNTYYVSSANGGVWKTSNGGRNWIPLASNGNRPGAFSQMAVSNATPPSFYGVGQGGLLTSSDGGRTWDAVNGKTPPSVVDVAISPADPDTLYVATPTGVWRTQDGGTNWQPIYPGPAGASLVETSPNGAVYAVVDGAGLVKSAGSDGAWVPLNDDFGSGRIANLAVDPANPTTVYVADEGGSVYVTRDGGTNWTPLPPGSP